MLSFPMHSSASKQCGQCAFERVRRRIHTGMLQTAPCCRLWRRLPPRPRRRPPPAARQPAAAAPPAPPRPRHQRPTSTSPPQSAPRALHRAPQTQQGPQQRGRPHRRAALRGPARGPGRGLAHGGPVALLPRLPRASGAPWHPPRALLPRVSSTTQPRPQPCAPPPPATPYLSVHRRVCGADSKAPGPPKRLRIRSRQARSRTTGPILPVRLGRACASPPGGCSCPAGASGGRGRGSAAAASARPRRATSAPRCARR
jgi:hypothetical protein